MIYLMFEYQLNLRLCSICKRVINQYRKKHFRRSGDTLYPCSLKNQLGVCIPIFPQYLRESGLKLFNILELVKVRTE